MSARDSKPQGSAPCFFLPLRDGRCAIVDAADAHLVAGPGWYLKRSSGVDHVAAFIAGKTVRLHRFLIRPKAGFIVEHINGDGLDNRRANLRVYYPHASRGAGIASDITAEYVRDRLAYDPESGALLWKESATQQLAWNRRYAGKQAGSLSAKGYYSIGLDDRRYAAHRVIWLLVHGEWPAGEVDHINGNPSDNRLANLRSATRSENVSNTRVKDGTETGLKGVKRARRKYRAQCSVRGVCYHLGVFATPEEAKRARDAFAEKAHGEFFRA